MSCKMSTKASNPITEQLEVTASRAFEKEIEARSSVLVAAAEMTGKML